MKKKTLVVIDRKKWSRGNQRLNRLLVDQAAVEKAEADEMAIPEDPIPKLGTLCCLGFAALALSATENEISGKSLPAYIDRILPGLSTEDHCNTEFSKKAAICNDNEFIDDKEREKQLKALAAENGFIFRFIN